MKKLFPETNKWVLDTLSDSETNHIKSGWFRMFNNVMQPESPIMYLNIEEFTNFLNAVLSGVYSEEIDTFKKTFCSNSGRFAVLGMPFVNNYDICGVLMIVKLIEERQLTECNIEDLIDEALNKLAPVLFYFSEDYNETVKILNKIYYPENFPYELMDHPKFVKEFAFKQYQNEHQIIPQILDRKFSFLLLNDDFVAYILSNANNLEGVYNLLPENRKSDHNLMKLLLSKEGMFLENLTAEQRDNDELVLIAVNCNPNALEFASHNLKNNSLIVLNTLKNDSMSLVHASIELRNDKFIVGFAASRNGYAFQFASLELRNNLEFIKSVISTNKEVNAMQYASEEIKNNVDLLKYCIGIAPVYVFENFITQNLIDNISEDEYKELVKLAIMVEDLSEQSLKNLYSKINLAVFNDEEICKLALSYYGVSLQLMPEHIKGNIEFVNLAIMQNPDAIKYANDTFRNDYHFMKNLIKRNPLIYHYLSDELKGLKELAYYAMVHNHLIYKYLPTELKNDPDIFNIYIYSSPSKMMMKNFQKNHLLDQDDDLIVWRQIEEFFPFIEDNLI